jgi:7-keto-8-aminopelargonate synthetase-like enzyme
VDQLRNALPNTGREFPKTRSAIIPLIIGAPEKAMKVADQLRAEGVYVPAIRYPTVARDKARLRITMTAGHEAEEVGKLTQAVRRTLSE